MGLNQIESERAISRIIKEYSAADVVSEVFTETSERDTFIKGVSTLSEQGVNIRVGGRRLRSLLGCETKDFAQHVVDDANFHLSGPEVVRMGPLLQILKDFETERMSKGDLDFFTLNATANDISDTFRALGFDTKICNATGNVNVVEVNGSGGTASFIDSNDSWQTQPPWPMFGVLADFKTFPTPHFSVDAAHGRLYEYPLEFSGVGKLKGDPLEPKRFAATGRILLWAATASNPDGYRLEVPCQQSQEAIFETVEQLHNLLGKIKINPDLKKMYSSGIRDMALALRVIELSNYEEIQATSRIPIQDYCRFMSRVSSAWWSGRGQMSFQLGV